MFSFKNVSLLAALAGLAIALPTPAEDAALVERQWGGHRHWKQPESIVWVTVTATAGAPTVAAATTAPVATVTAVASAPVVEVASSAAAVATPTTAASSTETGYMAIVSKWRAAGGLSALTQDSTLEANALKTCTDSGGALKHELNPGTMAQVLAQGTAADFESVYVGGWLCEIPTLPGLDGICATAAQGWSHDGVGHADILTSTSYSKIGCAFSEGVVACDLA